MYTPLFKEKYLGNGITILGLGPGDPNLLTRQAWEVLESSTEIYLRTRQHPVVDGLPAHLQVHSFDYAVRDAANLSSRCMSRSCSQVLEPWASPWAV